MWLNHSTTSPPTAEGINISEGWYVRRVLTYYCVKSIAIQSISQNINGNQTNLKSLKEDDDGERTKVSKSKSKGNHSKQKSINKYNEW